MIRKQKESLIASLKPEVEKCQAVVVLKQDRIQGPESVELRDKVRSEDASLRVLKNNLAKILLDGSKFESLKDDLKGPTAIVMCYGGLGAFKVLNDFAKDSDGKVKIISGNIDGNHLNEKEAIAVAGLPSMDALRAKIIGLIEAPLSGICRVVSTPGTNIARLLQQKPN